MHTTFRTLALLAALSLAGATGALGASAKSYQVTGPVVELTPTTVVVQKDGDKWEIARDPNVKGDAALKVGDRVTVHYQMTATRVETKAAADDKSSAPTPAASKPAKKK